MKKTLSKFLAVLMVLSITMGLAACSGGKQSKYVGEWKATSASAGETQLDFATMGFEMTMSLKADGTVSVNFAGETGTGKWEETDTGIKITEEDQSIEAKSVGDKLEIVESGVTMSFEKQQ